MLFPSKKAEFSSINLNNCQTIFEKVIQANLVDHYYIKLCKNIKTSSFMGGINTCHLSKLFIDTNNSIC